jgi:hypothetical protein
MANPLDPVVTPAFKVAAMTIDLEIDRDRDL